MKCPKIVRLFTYTENQPKSIDKEIKRRAESVKTSSSEESPLLVPYPITAFENEKPRRERPEGLRGCLRMVETIPPLPYEKLSLLCDNLLIISLYWKETIKDEKN